METVETQSLEDTGETTVAMQSLLNLSENSSASRIRTIELTEYCKHATTNLQVLKTKIQSLSATKNDAIRTRNELLARQKINAINLKSLFQTRIEFYNYKCDVKTDYVQGEVTLKNKRLKYNSFTTSYTNKWDAVEREHRKIPMASEILMIQKENMSLNDESIGLQSLLKKTEKDYFREISNHQNTLVYKTVEFVKECRIYFKFLNVNQKIRSITAELENLQCLQESRNHKPGHKADILKKSTIEIIQNDPNRQNFTKDSFSAHLKEFDNMLIPLGSLPLEVLEIPNEEDSFIHTKEGLVNLERYSDVETNYARKNSSSLELECLREAHVTYETESNNCNGQANETRDLASLEIQNPKDRETHTNDVLNTTSVPFSSQHHVTTSPSPSDGVSQYWRATQNAVEVEGTEIKARKVNESKNGKPKTPEKWEQADDNNPKKRKYSGDVAISTPPPETSPATTQKPRAHPNHAEKQLQNTETSITKGKVSKRESSIIDLWNINQVREENCSSNGEINNFSFLSTADDAGKTKTGTSSSIFTLF